MEQQKKYKSRYYKKRNQCVVNVVTMRMAPIPTAELPKLLPKYKGPLQIIEVLTNDTCRITFIGVDDRFYITTVNVSQLKVYRNSMKLKVIVKVKKPQVTVQSQEVKRVSLHPD